MASPYIQKKREVLPLVPLRDMVVFPHMMAPFIVGRESSVRALEQALQSSHKRIFLAAQKDPAYQEAVRKQKANGGEPGWQAYAETIRRDADKWRKVIKDANLVID